MYKRNISGSMALSLVMGLILSFLYAACFAEESITITTYYPSPYGSYRQLTADQIAIGSAYRNPTYADGTLYVQGNVGIGTTSPNSTKGSGYLDVKDVYLRDVSRWASAGSVSYTYYCFSDSSWGTPVCTNAGGAQGYCPSGYTQQLALGSWGRCYNSQSDYHSDYFLPPGGVCGTVTGYNIGGNYVGSAYVCSQ